MAGEDRIGCLSNIKGFYRDAYIRDIDRMMNNAYMRKHYPGAPEWFNEKVLPEMESDPHSRNVFISDSDTTFGFTIVKNQDEKKLCTFFTRDYIGIDPIFSHKHHQQNLLLVNSFKYLHTDKPLFTMPESAVDSFNRILKLGKFDLTDIVTRDNREREYIFNGSSPIIQEFRECTEYTTFK